MMLLKRNLINQALIKLPFFLHLGLWYQVYPSLEVYASLLHSSSPSLVDKPGGETNVFSKGVLSWIPSSVWSTAQLWHLHSFCQKLLTLLCSPPDLIPHFPIFLFLNSHFCLPCNSFLPFRLLPSKQSLLIGLNSVTFIPKISVSDTVAWAF